MATYGFVHGAALTPSDLARREETKRLAMSLGHSGHTWRAAGHIWHPYSDSYEITPLVAVLPLQPPLMVEASVPKKRLETTPVGPDGLLLAGSRADAMLRGWCAPFASGKKPAASPLLVVGQSAWSPVTKYLRSFHAYPSTYDRISIDELPTNPESLIAFRGNTARSRVIMVFMPSIAAAGIFAVQRWQRLSADLPLHSFVFFTLSSGDDAPPARVTETYHLIRWTDGHPSTPGAADQALAGGSGQIHFIAASHMRAGGTLRPGRTDEQRLGLVEPTVRDLTWYYNNEQAAAMARHTSSVAGHAPKRLKPNEVFTNPSRVMDAALQGGAGDFGRYTYA